MAQAVRIPRLGISEAGGKILAWRKREGDAVRPGDVVLEFEADKATVEITAETGGILRGVTTPEDAWVESDTVVAWILDASESLPKGGGAPEPDLPEDPPPSLPQPALASRPRSSPYARRLARETGVDWTTLKGTGPKGRVLARDVRLAGGARGPERNRDAIARRTEAGASIPQFWATRRIEAARMRSVFQRPRVREAGVSWSDAFLQALLTGVKAAPGMLSRPAEGTLGVGVAVASDRGLLLPVLRLERSLGLEAIAGLRQSTIERALHGRLSPSDMGDPDVILSNLGPMGVDAFNALLTPPATLAMAVGAIKEGVWVENGAMRATWTVEVTVTVDHRAADGKDAAEFLSAVASYFELGEGERWGDPGLL